MVKCDGISAWIWFSNLADVLEDHDRYWLQEEWNWIVAGVEENQYIDHLSTYAEQHWLLTPAQARALRYHLEDWMDTCETLSRPEVSRPEVSRDTNKVMPEVSRREELLFAIDVA